MPEWFQDCFRVCRASKPSIGLASRTDDGILIVDPDYMGEEDAAAEGVMEKLRSDYMVVRWMWGIQCCL